MSLESTVQAVPPVPANSSNNSASNTLKTLKDYRDELWYKYVLHRLDCKHVLDQFPRDAKEIDMLTKAYSIANEQNNMAVDLGKPTDAVWPYIIGFMKYNYEKNMPVGIYFLLNASLGIKKERCAAALFLLGEISKNRGKNELAGIMYALAYLTGNCVQSYYALRKLKLTDPDYYLEKYKDAIILTDAAKNILQKILTPSEYITLQSGGRHTLRKKNPTKRRVPRKSTKRNKKRGTYKRRK